MLHTPVNGVDVGAAQLLMNQTLLSSALLLCLVPFFDQLPDFCK